MVALSSSSLLSSAEIVARIPSLKDSTEVPSTEWRKQAGTKPSYTFPYSEVEEGSYRIRDERMEEVAKGVEKLAKRAAKLGLPLPTFETVRVEDLPRVVRFGSHSNKACWALTGEVGRFHVLRPVVGVVKLPGHHFVATIQHLGEDGNLLKSIPSFEGSLPASYRTDKPTCDHCRTWRARHETFVLQHESGSFTRVGRNCLVDYIGSASAEQVIFAASLADAFESLVTDSDPDGGYGGMGYSIPRYTPEVFLTVVGAVISKCGWVSRSTARAFDGSKTATVDEAALFLNPNRPPRSKPVITEDDILPAHVEEARLAVEWAKNIDPGTHSDYLWNIKVVAGLPTWTGQNFGLGGSILASYQREMNKLKRAEFEKKLPSVYVGEVGTRFGAGKGKKAVPALTARILGVYKIEGQFGLTSIVRMQAPVSDTEVADLVWFASGSVTVNTDPSTIQRAVEASEAYNKAQSALYYADRSAEGYDALRVVYLAAAKANDEAQSALRNATREIKDGDTVNFAGTVKAHRMSKYGRKETVLTRCSLALSAESCAVVSA